MCPDTLFMYMYLCIVNEIEKSKYASNVGSSDSLPLNKMKKILWYYQLPYMNGEEQKTNIVLVRGKTLRNAMIYLAFPLKIIIFGFFAGCKYVLCFSQTFQI